LEIIIDHDSPEIMRPAPESPGPRACGGDSRRFVGEAATLLASRTNRPLTGLALILLDAVDCPADLGPRRRERAEDVDTRFEVACVVASLEYETWFSDTTKSFAVHEFLAKRPGQPARRPADEAGMDRGPLPDRQGREEVQPPLDQLPMTMAMDLAACHDRSSSFHKFCREQRRYEVP